MKCLILGGGGFLGSHLADALLAAGHGVRIFERPKIEKYRTFLSGEDLEWVEGDFLNQDDVAQALEGCEIVYHLVATMLPKPSNANPVYDVETNLVGTLELLNLISRSQVRKIIFLSSGGTVYGHPTSVPISETHPNDPLCSYGITKLAIEKYLHLYHCLHSLDYCVLRLSNPFGERQSVSAGQGAVTVFLDRALRGQSIEIWGDGQVVRDYIYVSDVVRAMVLAIQPTGEERIFNIGSGQGLSLNDILRQIEQLSGRKLSIGYTPSRAFDVPVNVLDIERARTVLGWVPEVTFSDGLQQTCKWMLEQLQAVNGINHPLDILACRS